MIHPLVMSLVVRCLMVLGSHRWDMMLRMLEGSVLVPSSFVHHVQTNLLITTAAVAASLLSGQCVGCSARDEGKHVTPALRGVLAEIATKGINRHVVMRLPQSCAFVAIGSMR